MKSILDNILHAKKNAIKLLAILLDPDKIRIENIENLILKIEESPATHVFVGGSLVQNNILNALLSKLKMHCTLPIILFPGHPSQISSLADGILFLNLLSGRNPDYLIDFQVQAVPLLKKTNLEIIATAYLLIDGGTKSAVERISNTKPMSQRNPKYILQTAQAGELMGNQLIYLEAGSGAKNPVKPETVALVSKNTKIPIIVGGGIRTKKQIDLAYKNGANLVVIGTAFEIDTNFFDDI